MRGNSEPFATVFDEHISETKTDAVNHSSPQLTAFTEGLTLTERLVRTYDTGAQPSPEDLAAMRDGVVRWREQLEGFKQRLAAATVLGERPLPLQ